MIVHVKGTDNYRFCATPEDVNEFVSFIARKQKEWRSTIYHRLVFIDNIDMDSLLAVSTLLGDIGSRIAVLRKRIKLEQSEVRGRRGYKVEIRHPLVNGGRRARFFLPAAHFSEDELLSMLAELFGDQAYQDIRLRTSVINREMWSNLNRYFEKEGF